MRRLLRIQEVADAAGLTLATTYFYSSTDPTFPPVFDRVGTVLFFHHADVSHWVKSRRKRK